MPFARLRRAAPGAPPPPAPPRRPVRLRLSAAAFVAAAFLGGLGAGLLGAHAWGEADAPLSALDDAAALREAHGDDVTVHGRVVERRVEARTVPGDTTFAYLLTLDDGEGRAAFQVTRAEYDRIPDGRWIRLELRWDGAAWVPGSPEAAVQPWMWRGAFGLAFVAAGAGVTSRLAGGGVEVERRGDLVEIRAKQP